VALDVELVPTSSVYNAMRNEPRFKIQQHMMQRAVTPPIECILVSTVLHSFAMRRFVGALA
jgi:hypothetical protein